MEFNITNDTNPSIPQWWSTSALIATEHPSRGDNWLNVNEYSRSRLNLRNRPTLYYAYTPFALNDKKLDIKLFYAGRDAAPSYIAADLVSVIRRHITIYHQTEENNIHPRFLICNCVSQSVLTSVKEQLTTANIQAQYNITLQRQNPMLHATIQSGRGNSVVVYKAAEANRVCVILTNSCSNGFFLKLMSVLPLLFPDYYGEETLANTKYPITNLQDMLAALNSFNADTFDALLHEWLSSYEADFVRKQVLQSVARFSTTYAQTYSRRINDSIRQLQRLIEQNTQTLTQNYTDLRTYQKDLLLIHDIEKGLIEYQEFLLKQNNILLADFHDNQITLGFNVLCTNYDRELLERLLTADNQNFIKNHHLETVFTELFMKDDYMLRISAPFILDIVACRVTHSSGITLPVGMPNPHYTEFRCWGSYRPFIEQALLKQDFITATQAAVAATSNLNFADAAVMGTLCDYWQSDTPNTYNNVPCVEVVDTKELLTILQLRRRLNNENN